MVLSENDQATGLSKWVYEINFFAHGNLKIPHCPTGISLPPGGDLQPLTLRFITASINLFPTWVCELLNFGTINIVS